MLWNSHLFWLRSEQKSKPRSYLLGNMGSVDPSVPTVLQSLVQIPSSRFLNCDVIGTKINKKAKIGTCLNSFHMFFLVFLGYESSSWYQGLFGAAFVRLNLTWHKYRHSTVLADVPLKEVIGVTLLTAILGIIYLLHQHTLRFILACQHLSLLHYFSVTVKIRLIVHYVGFCLLL